MLKNRIIYKEWKKIYFQKEIFKANWNKNLPIIGRKNVSKVELDLIRSLSAGRASHRFSAGLQTALKLRRTPSLKKDQEKQFAKIWNIIRKSWRLHTPWEHLEHLLLGSLGTMEIWIGQHRCLSWIIWTREMKMWKSPKTSPIRGLILSSEDEIRLLDHLHPGPRGPRVSMRL